MTKDPGDQTPRVDLDKSHGERDLDDMTRDQLVELGTRLNDVDIAFRKPRWPSEETKAERRAERSVAAWLVLATVSSVAFIGVYLFWPWQVPADASDVTASRLWHWYTPLLGLTMGTAILSLSIGAVLFTKKFIPDEVSVQARHDDPSSEVDRRTVVAELADSLHSSTLPRRGLIKKTLLLSGGALGIMALLPLGGLVKNPWQSASKPSCGCPDGPRDTPGKRSTCVDTPAGCPTSLSSGPRISMPAGSSPCSRSASRTWATMKRCAAPSSVFATL